MLEDNQYSLELRQYIGRVELEAFQSKNSPYKDPYECFCEALRYLSDERLSPEDSKLARELLNERIRETRPSNIGCASGEVGDAD